eukprot:11606756-Heterocapsa_arctica.AAC.1
MPKACGPLPGQPVRGSHGAGHGLRSGPGPASELATPLQPACATPVAPEPNRLPHTRLSRSGRPCDYGPCSPDITSEVPRAHRATLAATESDEDSGVAASGRSPSSRRLPGRQRSSSPGLQAQISA